MAGRDEDESPQYEGSVSVADDPQMPPDSEVFPENRLDVGIDVEHLGEVLEAEDLKAADEAEENADKEKDNGSVKPRQQFQDAGNGVAHDGVAEKRHARPAGAVPPYLIRRLGGEARQHEHEQQLQRSLLT